MASDSQEPEIVLYDLACKKDVCFSLFVWRIRLMLNYKRIPYRTVFLEFQDITPTLRSFGISPHSPPADPSYTVPTIYVPATGKYLMDSPAISEFLEETFPDPHVQLVSDIGKDIRAKSLPILNVIIEASILPRVMNIQRLDAQVFFQRTREADLGHKIEDLLVPGREDESWKSIDGDLRSLGELIMKAREDGPFVLGKQVSYIDFFITGFLEFGRVVDQGVFERFRKYPGFIEIYEACQPFMNKVD